MVDAEVIIIFIWSSLRFNLTKKCFIIGYVIT